MCPKRSGAKRSPTEKPVYRSQHICTAICVCTVRDGSSVKNLLFGLKLPACCDVDVKRRLEGSPIGFRVFLTGHECFTAVNSCFCFVFFKT